MHRYLFISNIIPGDDKNPEIDTQKATYLAQKGIMDALSSQVDSFVVLAYPQYRSCSKSHIIWRKGERLNLNGIDIIKIPTLNLPIVRILYRNFYFLLNIIKWCIKNKGDNKHIIQYNAFSPALFVTLAGHLFKNTDVSAFLYDLGMPPKSYHYSWAKQSLFKIIDYHAKLFINKMDYAYVITTAVAKDYAPKIKTLLIDGGLSEDILSKLPLADNRKKDKFVLLLAGNLSEFNGVKLAIDTAKLLQKKKNIEFWFAGKGDLVDDIIRCSKKLSNVIYKGFFSTDELFDVYSQVDVLLNLRIMPQDESKYLFPSKLLEYMATGRRVISTDIAHVKDQYGNYCDILLHPTLEELSKKILEIYEETEQNTDNRSQEYMIRTHTWDAQMNRIIEALEVTQYE